MVPFTSAARRPRQVPDRMTASESLELTLSTHRSQWRFSGRLNAPPCWDRTFAELGEQVRVRRQWSFAGFNRRSGDMIAAERPHPKDANSRSRHVPILRTSLTRCQEAEAPPKPGHQSDSANLLSLQRGRQRVSRRCKRPDETQRITVQASRRQGPTGRIAHEACRTGAKRRDRKGRPVPARSASPARADRDHGAACLAAGRHGTAVAGDRCRWRPFAAAATHQRASLHRPRPGQPAGAGGRGARLGGQDPRSAHRHRPAWVTTCRGCCYSRLAADIADDAARTAAS